MPSRPCIPPELKLGPFTIGDAKAAGVTPTALRGRSWIRLERGIYCWAGVIADQWRILDVYQRLLPKSVFAGRTAAWLHGLPVEPHDPIEIIVPANSGVRSRRGLFVRRAELKATDVMTVRDLRATAVLRTLSDLCSRLKGVEALALMDASLRLKLINSGALEDSSICVRSWASLAEPAESVMETRLRWLLIKAGLPRPTVQRNLKDVEGRFLGRADLFYPKARLVIEYDGGNHRERLVEDNRRQNQLINAGFTMLRFTGADIRDRPYTIVAQVRRAISGAAGVSSRRPAAAPR